MKTLLSLLAALSLAANVALVIVLFAGRGGADSAPDTSAATTAGKPSASDQNASADSKLWTQLSSDDLPGMVQRLRDAGVPIDYIRALAAARIREGFAERRKALSGNTADQAFWKSTLTLDPRLRAAQMQLYREEREALRQLLGPDAEAPESSLYQTKRYESVPAARLPEVKDLERLFDERRQEIYSTNVGAFTAEQGRKLEELRKEQEAALARLLTPEELLEYNLRNSDVSNSLRSELTAFNPTEQEFREMYKLMAPAGSFQAGMTQEEMQRRSDAQRAAREQIKTMLGPERGAEYERATNYQYRQTSQLVSRLELPPETAVKLWDMKTDIEKRAREIGRDVDMQTRLQQLAALKQEADQRIVSLVGARGVQPYQQYGGDWMRMLAPPTPGPRPGTGAPIIRTSP